jgi:hypothetical protein
MRPWFSEKFSIPPGQIRIKTGNILKSLHVPEHVNDPYVDSLIDEYMRQSVDICAPLAEYGLFETPVFENKTDMLLGGHTFHLGKIVLSALRQSSHIAFFVCTAGDKVENLSKELLKEGHSLEGLIVDLVGSEIAEETAEYIHQKIGEDMIQRGLRITNRYSPGYCLWPVSDQQKLFPLMEGHTCGVTLNDSSLMLPIKSVSGIIGVGKEVKNRGYSCSRCDAEFCIYRDKR